MSQRKVALFLRCADEQTAERYRLSAIGVHTPFGRWEMVPAHISDLCRSSLNFELADFRGDNDLQLLRSLPGVLEVGFINERIRLTDPRQARREYWAACSQSAA